MTNLQASHGGLLVTATAVLTLGSCGEPRPDERPALEMRTHLPPGYALRLDRVNRDRTNFVTASESDSLTVKTGPAGILYRPDQVVDADRYTVRATFTEIDAPIGHREGFGLFIGGENLASESQHYIYFLVRGDGRYLIKQRFGRSTLELSRGWQPSDAVRLATQGAGDVTNDLMIAVEGRQLRMLCNGETLADLMIEDGDVRGVAGIRVNHNLHVRVEDFVIGG